MPAARSNRRSSNKESAAHHLPSVEQPPRPCNRWILYRRWKLKQLPPLQPGEKKRTQEETSKMISDMWKNEDEYVRVWFEAEAERIKEEHKSMYPDYKYRPKRKDSKKEKLSGSRGCTRKTPTENVDGFEGGSLYAGPYYRTRLVNDCIQAEDVSSTSNLPLETKPMPNQDQDSRHGPLNFTGDVYSTSNVFGDKIQNFDSHTTYDLTVELQKIRTNNITNNLLAYAPQIQPSPENMLPPLNFSDDPGLDAHNHANIDTEGALISAWLDYNIQN